MGAYRIDWGQRGGATRKRRLDWPTESQGGSEMEGVGRSTTYPSQIARTAAIVRDNLQYVDGPRTLDLLHDKLSCV